MNNEAIITYTFPHHPDEEALAKVEGSPRGTDLQGRFFASLRMTHGKIILGRNTTSKARFVTTRVHQQQIGTRPYEIYDES